MVQLEADDMRLPESLIDQSAPPAGGHRNSRRRHAVPGRVPIRVDLFNKPLTNLLLKRPAPGMPYLALVDESLAYVGGDPGVKTVFALTAGRQGWRALSLDCPADRDAGHVLQDALRILGFERQKHTPLPEAPAGLLARFGRPMRDHAGVRPTLGRENQIAEIVAALRRREPVMPVIVGPAGSGKTNLLYGVARGLADRPGGGDVVEINLLELFSVTPDSGRMRCMVELFGEMAEAHAVAAIEHVELLVGLAELGSLVLSRALDEGARIIGTALPDAVERLNCRQLARRVQVVELAELPRAEPDSDSARCPVRLRRRD